MKSVIDSEDVCNVTETSFSVTKAGFTKVAGWLRLMGEWNVRFQDIERTDRIEDLRAFLDRAGYEHSDDAVTGARILIRCTMQAFQESRH